MEKKRTRGKTSKSSVENTLMEDNCFQSLRQPCSLVNYGQCDSKLTNIVFMCFDLQTPKVVNFSMFFNLNCPSKVGSLRMFFLKWLVLSPSDLFTRLSLATCTLFCLKIAHAPGTSQHIFQNIRIQDSHLLGEMVFCSHVVWVCVSQPN